ncbi:MAG: leucine-rich repeat domain-containing protein [Clostridium celatum]|nr:leucine-rich repeat domain-containing protein [Clostridium celatum]MDU4979338.1 leucine-rich repeat domain-containing protein [Clostridium celatum]
MKRYISMILTMCLMFTLVPFKPLKVFASTDTLNFADSKLNDIFCEFVGKANGQSVTKSEVENKMKYIYDNHIQMSPEIDISGVSDLTGIEDLKDIAYPIRRIRISGAVDLTPIKDFSFEDLELNDQTNSNLQVFNTSTSLQNSLDRLVIKDYYTSSDIVDLSPIGTLKNLGQLHIVGTKVSDITPIGQLKNLRTLTLDGFNRYNETTVDLNIIKNLDKLYSLSLARMNLTSESLKPFSEVGTFTSLTMFEILNDSGVQDIRYLENNSTIVNLTLHDCGLDDRAIDIVKTIPNLANLSLADNYIENINNLNGLSGLLSLNVSSNGLENVDVVATLNNLTRLDCSYNYITDVSSLTGLTKLTGLDISYNFIDVDGTQKGIVDSIPVQYNKETTPQRAVTGDTLIEMNVGDEIPFFFDSEQLQGNGYNIAEISNRGYRSIFGDYIIASDDVNLLEVVNTTVPYGSGSTTFKALKSGETKVKVLFRNIDSVLTKSEITIKIKDVPKPVIKGSYTVEYQDEKGNILDSKTLNDLVLGNYIEFAKFFDGYTLIDDTMKSFDLTETEPSKTIVFKYVKNEEPKPVIKGSYTVKFQDEEGNVLDSKSFNDLVLGRYVAFADFIDGYTLNDEGIKYIELTELEPNQVIIFKYKKNEGVKPIILGSYTVEYQDENGNVLDSKTLSELYLGKYTEIAKKIDGYNLDDEETKVIDLTEESPNGTIIFKYKKQEVPVTLEKPKEEVKEEFKAPQETLPQTGDPFSSNILMMLGVSLIGLGVGFNKKFKR